MPSLSSKPQCQWMEDWSRTSLQGSTGYSQKPNLILVDNTPVSLDKIMWLSPKVITKYSKESFKPASHLGKMMDTKAYLTLIDQPWKHYVLGLSITDSELLRLHFYDHSGGAISPSINIHTDTEVFIYIDYWVEESEQRTALHEVNMMKLVQEINRVPKLQHYWVIEVEPGIVDKTEQYHG
ncbi:hypothetical protein F5J12DRAFT_786919 [Pisolithus orientalis]|uniref:uncharacterized protein n=1 Tax=Pisolithus orientalis TaxID=936130 RepID=UPI0022246BFF|nr:uncharacterized protein F5J12DRAFT_786919 [Pisolithus orientalis]KAI5988228.1 hypothetical protein F5J12DRAFT_786919 [Pisolithus orientalis]